MWPIRLPYAPPCATCVKAVGAIWTRPFEQPDKRGHSDAEGVPPPETLLKAPVWSDSALLPAPPEPIPPEWRPSSSLNRTRALASCSFSSASRRARSRK
jgi:hypothetical protein